MISSPAPRGFRLAQKRRFDGQVSCQWHEIVVGEDEHGQWAVLPAGEPQRFAGGNRVWFAGDVMICHPANGWWTAQFWDDLQGWITEPGGTAEAKTLSNYSYVDIAMPTRTDDGVVSFVDLTLDVVTRADGSIVLLDEDEVAEDAVRYGIPDSVLARARRSGEAVFAAMISGHPPFDGTADAWRRRFHKRHESRT